jgi:hypothetical protein
VQCIADALLRWSKQAWPAWESGVTSSKSISGKRSLSRSSPLLTWCRVSTRAGDHSQQRNSWLQPYHRMIASEWNAISSRPSNGAPSGRAVPHFPADDQTNRSFHWARKAPYHSVIAGEPPQHPWSDCRGDIQFDNSVGIRPLLAIPRVPFEMFSSGYRSIEGNK